MISIFIYRYNYTKVSNPFLSAPCSMKEGSGGEGHIYATDVEICKAENITLVNKYRLSTLLTEIQFYLLCKSSIAFLKKTVQIY